MAMAIASAVYVAQFKEQFDKKDLEVLVPVCAVCAVVFTVLTTLQSLS